MFGDRFSSSTSCSRWLHETEPDRPDQSLTCCFLKVATHPKIEILCSGPVSAGVGEGQLADIDHCLDSTIGCDSPAG